LGLLDADLTFGALKQWTFFRLPEFKGQFASEHESFADDRVMSTDASQGDRSSNLTCYSPIGSRRGSFGSMTWMHMLLARMSWSRETEVGNFNGESGLQNAPEGRWGNSPGYLLRRVVRMALLSATALQTVSNPLSSACLHAFGRAGGEPGYSPSLSSR
jgi:hypothetical protein